MTVKCDCGYFGPLDDCSHNRCPNCGYRVERDRTEEEIRIRAAKRMAAKRAIERRAV
jgi:DNA-directed RNA polymerase subunit RPC12/RpoP